MFLKKCRATVKEFVDSKWFAFSQFAFTAICIIFHLIVPGLLILSLEMTLLLFFSDDTFSALFPLIFGILLVTECYEHYYVLLKYYWVLFPLAVGLIFHLIYYRKPFVRGRFTYCFAGVSAALLLGGLGTIQKEEYLAGISFYYMLGLGLVPLLLYLLLSSRLAVRRQYDVVGRIAEIGYVLGFLAMLLVVKYYVIHFSNWEGPFSPPEIPYRNFCTTVMMFALPMPCYFICKNRLHLISILALYIGMLLSASRTALLFGTIELVLCLFSVYKTDDTRKKYYRRLAVILLVPLIGLVITATFTLFIGQSGRLGSVGKHFVNPNEERVRFYKRGLEDFLRRPILGWGLANMKNVDIFKCVEGSLSYYHNAVIQVAASLGLVGVVAYGYQFIARAKYFWEIRHTRNVLMAVPFIGVILVSQTNPGIFSPLPTVLLLTMMFAALESARKCEAQQPEPAGQRKLVTAKNGTE